MAEGMTTRDIKRKLRGVMLKHGFDIRGKSVPMNINRGAERLALEMLAEGLRCAEEIAEKQYQLTLESSAENIERLIRAEREKVEGEYGDNSCS